MTKTEKFATWLDERDACGEAIAWVRTLPPDAGLEGAWAVCQCPDWMLWLAKRLELPARPLQLFAIDCARDVLHLVPTGEDRPRVAIEAAERYLAGECSLDELRAAARAAWSAAESAARAGAWAAWAAARAAESAARAAAAEAAWAAAAEAAWAAARAAWSAAESAARAASPAWDTARFRQTDMLRARTEGVVFKIGGGK